MLTLLDSVNTMFENVCKGQDIEIDNWLFMKTPISILIILSIYLIFVFKIGPNYMKNKKPYKLKETLIIYNGFQVLFSLWMLSKVFLSKQSLKDIFSSTCSTELSKNRNFAIEIWAAAWWYFFSKIIDLFDTIFFVLRKKQNQVTFLHVYHHTITALFSWCYLKYLPGEQGIVIGALNSFVHVIMYFYYMVSAMGPDYQKYLWWKKYMTWIQLIQFGLMLIYLVTVIVMDCNLPKSLTFFLIGNIIIFVYLFTNFYLNAYKKKDENENNNLINIDSQASDEVLTDLNNNVTKEIHKKIK